jgi:ribonucleoside-diphosphate reductase alpha chain
MYMYAWKSGIKTTYYLRSRPATRIAKATVSAGKAAAADQGSIDQGQATAAVFCSLENPEYCEACQ